MAGIAPGLETSRWARLGSPGPRMIITDQQREHRSRSLPPTSYDANHMPSSSSSPPPANSRVQALHRFEQSCQRLRWKFMDLEASYARALSPSDWAFTPADAERNFKVDFYEFYAWIEQALVFLLLVFGVAVPHRRVNTRATHAYHHDVLRALDDEANPLHGVLGAGDVNHALWKAKELRNRWKDAAEGRETPPLKMYDLRWIVMQILGGLEAAYVMARSEAEKEGSGVDEEEGWDWMVESMDWES